MLLISGFLVEACSMCSIDNLCLFERELDHMCVTWLGLQGIRISECLHVYGLHVCLLIVKQAVVSCWPSLSVNTAIAWLLPRNQ